MVQPTKPIKNTTAPANEHKQETKPGVGVESIEDVATKGGKIDSDDEDQKDVSEGLTDMRANIVNTEQVEGDYVVGDKVQVKKDSMVQEPVYEVDKLGKPDKGEATYILKEVGSNKLYQNGQPVKESDVVTWKPKNTK